MSDRYDVVVVGARVAGSTLAALLGKAGVSVLVLDQARFPSDTLSTHVIFDDSFSVWEDAGAWPRIRARALARNEATFVARWLNNLRWLAAVIPS